MPGPTAPGARVGGWKYQADHRFRRGQPVYLASAGTYALATIATGSDGVVGDTTFTTFELVGAGELDRLSGLTPGATYSLSTSPGEVIVGAENPLYKALSSDTAVLTGAVQVAYTPPVEEDEGFGPLDPRYALTTHRHEPIYLRTIDDGAVISIEPTVAGPVFDESDGRQVLVA